MDDDKCPCCGPKKLVQFFDKTTFSPSHTKSIAAGRARGSPSSRKIMKKIPFPVIQQASYGELQFWEVADVFLLLLSFPSSIFLPPESINQSSYQHCPLSLVSCQQFIPAPIPPSPLLLSLLLLSQARVRVDHRSGSDSRASTRLRSRHCFLWAGQSLCWHWEPQ